MNKKTDKIWLTDRHSKKPFRMRKLCWNDENQNENKKPEKKIPFFFSFTVWFIVWNWNWCLNAFTSLIQHCMSVDAFMPFIQCKKLFPLLILPRKIIPSCCKKFMFIYVWQKSIKAHLWLRIDERMKMRNDFECGDEWHGQERKLFWRLEIIYGYQFS